MGCCCTAASGGPRACAAIFIQAPSQALRCAALGPGLVALPIWDVHSLFNTGRRWPPDAYPPAATTLTAARRLHTWLREAVFETALGDAGDMDASSQGWGSSSGEGGGGASVTAQQGGGQMEQGASWGGDEGEEGGRREEEEAPTSTLLDVLWDQGPRLPLFRRWGV